MSRIPIENELARYVGILREAKFVDNQSPDCYSDRLVGAQKWLARWRGGASVAELKAELAIALYVDRRDPQRGRLLRHKVARALANVYHAAQQPTDLPSNPSENDGY